MNKYTITFPFQGEYQYVYITANQMANAVLDSTDDILDFRFNNDGQDFEQRLTIKDKKYDVTFNSNNPRCFNVYDVDEDDFGGTIVEENIPWLLLKIEDEDKNEIYNLNDYV